MKASGKTLATTLAVVAVSLVSSVITARVLGPEGRGLLSAALLIATLGAGASQFGLASSLVYHRGGGWRFGYGRLLASSMLFVAILAVALAHAGHEIGGDARLRDQLLVTAGLAGLMAVQNYLMTLGQLNAGLGSFNAMRVGLVGGNLLALLVLLAFLDDIQFEDILFSQLAVLCIAVPAGLLWAKKTLSSGSSLAPLQDRSTRWRDVCRYGMNHHGTVLLGIVLLNFDKLLMLKMGTVVQFGFYALAFSTSRLIGALQEAISTALFARFAGRDVEQLSIGVRAAFRTTFVPMLVISACGAALSPWLITLAFGQEFAPMAAPFAILLFECVIGHASWMLAQRFNADGRPGMVFVRQLISVLPIFAALPFLPAHNLHIYLSGLMLIGALLRLAVTLCLYPLVLKETVPAILPTAMDFRVLRSLLSAGRAA